MSIGSANLTEPGYRHNLEQLAVLDFTPDGSVPKNVLQDALAFLELLRACTPGGGSRKLRGPQLATRELLKRTTRLIARWPEGRSGRSQPMPAFVPVWPGDRSLFAALRHHLGRHVQPDYAEVLSPFSDARDGEQPSVAGSAGDDDR
ncbi:MAG TPA: hypothetical protein VGB13_01595 [Candidatus Krumholzibacteria bacterium]